MKKIFIILFCLFLISTPIFAEGEDGEDIDWSGEPKTEEVEESPQLFTLETPKTAIFNYYAEKQRTMTVEALDFLPGATGFNDSNDLVFVGWSLSTSGTTIETIISADTTYYALYTSRMKYYFMLPGHSDWTSTASSNYMYIGEGSCYLPWEYDFTTANRWYIGAKNFAQYVISQPTTEAIWKGVSKVYPDLDPDYTTLTINNHTYSRAKPSVDYDNKGEDFTYLIHNDVWLSYTTTTQVSFQYVVDNALLNQVEHPIKAEDGSFNQVEIAAKAIEDFTTDGKTYAAKVNSTGALYQFDGWYEDAAYTKKASGNYDTSTARTFYGRYLPITYKVIYKWNNAPTGVDLPEDAAYYFTGDNYNLIPVTTISVDIEKDAWGNVTKKSNFLGWIDAHNGIIENGNSTVIGDWSVEDVEVESHKVTYKWSGITDVITSTYNLPAEATYVVNEKWNVDDSAQYKRMVVKSNGGMYIYRFDGWKIDDTYLTGEQTMGNKDIVLTGVWTMTKESVNTGDGGGTLALINLLIVGLSVACSIGLLEIAPNNKMPYRIFVTVLNLMMLAFLLTTQSFFSPNVVLVDNYTFTFSMMLLVLLLVMSITTFGNHIEK